VTSGIPIRSANAPQSDETLLGLSDCHQAEQQRVVRQAAETKLHVQLQLFPAIVPQRLDEDVG
jgi:hypothetical protein